MEKLRKSHCWFQWSVFFLRGLYDDCGLPKSLQSRHSTSGVFMISQSAAQSIPYLFSST
jgi:hypothetical protein